EALRLAKRVGDDFMVNHQKLKKEIWHYDRFGGWQPIKATKLTVLLFIYGREMITAFDLIEEFDYTYSSAHCRLSQLKREGFVKRTGGGHWCLSDRGYDKLDHSGVLKGKADEKLRRERQAEGRVWYIEDDKMWMAKNVGEMLLTLAEAKKVIRELKEARLT
ncbi:unnamed protein product, partial [marine sediment metagenome]